jgi:hypothetical protein
MEAHVEAGREIHEPDAVRTHDADAGRACDGGDAFLLARALLVDFGKACAEDDDRTHADLDAGFERRDHVHGRYGNERKIDGLADVADRRERRQVLNDWRPRIDRIDRPGEVVGFQERQRHAADARRIGRRADDRDRIGPEHRLERGYVDVVGIFCFASLLSGGGRSAWCTLHHAGSRTFARR